MELDLQHKPNHKVSNFALVDIPPTAGSDATFVRKVCSLLDKGNGIVCVTKRSMENDVSILENLRDSLPGFVALLDHHESSDIPVSLAKSLSLGSDDTDEKVLHSRWVNFSQTIQRSTLPFTLIVSEADSLSKSRLTQINDFLRPLKGRLILTGCDDVVKLFGASEAGLISPSSDNNVLQFSDRGTEPETTEHPTSAAPSIVVDVAAEPPTITDEVLPGIKPAPVPAPITAPITAPIKDASHADHRSSRKNKPFGWLSAGLGIGGVLGFLAASLPTGYDPADLNLWIRGIADGSFIRDADDPAQNSETVSAKVPENDALQKEDSSAITTLPMAAVDDPQDESSMLPTDAEATADATTTPENPATDLAALEKAPALDSSPAVDVKAVTEPAPLVPSTAERARLANVYIGRAESAWDMNNLQQSLLEIARGLDADPDNQRLQELREQVLAELNASMAQ